MRDVRIDNANVKVGYFNCGNFNSFMHGLEKGTAG